MVSTSKQSSQFQTKQLPGLFGEGAIFEPGREIGEQLQNIIGGISTGGTFQEPFEQAVQRPQFGPAEEPTTP